MKKFYLIFYGCFMGALYAALFFIPKLPTAKILNYFNVEAALLLFTCGFLYLSAKSRNPVWKMTLFALILAAFTLPLLRVWQNAVSNYYMILGLLPWSDANGYFTDASLLLDGSLLGSFSGNRPLFPGFLATLLALSGRNLQLVLIFLTIVTAVVIFIFVFLVNNRSKPFAGILTLIFSWFYCLQVVGNTMTEQLGLPLGVLALAALIIGVSSKNRFWYAAGLLGLTFALLTRAGAFFILPFLLFYGLYRFGTEKQAVLRSGLVFTCAIFIPFLINAGVGKSIAAPNSASMGNFSYTLYGQAVGGKGWTQVFADHPELNKMDERERSSTAYRISLEIIKENPGLFLQGVIKAWKDYFVPSQFSVFSFILAGNKTIDLLLQSIATLFMLAGIIICFIKFKEPLYGMTLAGFAGIFLSLPFIPPSEASWMRTQAATIIWNFWLVELAWFTLLQVFVHHTKKETFSVGNNKLLAGFGLLLLGMTVLGPLSIRLFFAHAPGRQLEPCSPGTTGIQFQVYKNSHVTIQDGNAASRFPMINRTMFDRSMAGFPGVYTDFAKTLSNLPTPLTLIYTLEVSGNGLWIAGPPALASAEGKTIFACVSNVHTPYSVIYIRQFKISGQK